jgi:ethanolamine utilization cobalamin adenosyltransferase
MQHYTFNECVRLAVVKLNASRKSKREEEILAVKVFSMESSGGNSLFPVGGGKAS